MICAFLISTTTPFSLLTPASGRHVIRKVTRGAVLHDEMIRDVVDRIGFRGKIGASGLNLITFLITYPFLEYCESLSRQSRLSMRNEKPARIVAQSASAPFENMPVLPV